MNPTTIFNAYVKANFWENHWRECRGSSFGIAVDKDEYALKFQKANRQAYFFEKRIRDMLSGLTMRQRRGFIASADANRWVLEYLT